MKTRRAAKATVAAKSTNSKAPKSKKAQKPALSAFEKMALKQDPNATRKDLDEAYDHPESLEGAGLSRDGFDEQ